MFLLPGGVGYGFSAPPSPSSCLLPPIYIQPALVRSRVSESSYFNFATPRSNNFWFSEIMKKYKIKIKLTSTFRYCTNIFAEIQFQGRTSKLYNIRNSYIED